jgi:hypothetical protein
MQEMGLEDSEGYAEISGKLRETLEHLKLLREEDSPISVPAGDDPESLEALKAKVAAMEAANR